MTQLELILESARRTQASCTVLGSRGFIGTHLCAFLRDNDIPFSTPPRGDESIFSRPLGHVIYAVGLTADYATRPFDTVEAHVGFIARLLERGKFDSLLYLSSTRLYDSGGGAAGCEDTSLSLNPNNPRHLYDFSKGLGEALCLHTRDNARVARLSSVYAEDLSGTNFLYQMVRASVERAPDIATSPSLARDYIDVADVVQLLVAIAFAGRRRIYNVASGENLANDEVLCALGEISGHAVVAKNPPISSSAPRIDIQAIESDFGFRPRRLGQRLPALVASARRALGSWSSSGSPETNSSTT